MYFSRKHKRIVLEKGLYEFMKNPDLGTLSLVNFLIGIAFFALVGEYLLGNHIVYEMGLDRMFSYIAGGGVFVVIFLLAFKTKRKENDDRVEPLQKMLARMEQRYGNLADTFLAIQKEMSTDIAYNLKGRGLGMLTPNWFVSFYPVPMVEKLADIAAVILCEGHDVYFITDDGLAYKRGIGNSIGDYRYISGLIADANPFLLTKDSEVTLDNGITTTVKELFDKENYNAISKEFNRKRAATKE